MLTAENADDADLVSDLSCDIRFTGTEARSASSFNENP
jgi:hypothetical protein